MTAFLLRLAPIAVGVGVSWLLHRHANRSPAGLVDRIRNAGGRW